MQYSDLLKRCNALTLNGLRCGAPPMRHRDQCRWHHQARISLTPTSPYCAVVLPSLDDANAIQMAIMRVCQALLDGRVNAKHAGLLLYALQLASANLKRMDLVPSKEQLEQEREMTELEQAEQRRLQAHAADVPACPSDVPACPSNVRVCHSDPERSEGEEPAVVPRLSKLESGNSKLAFKNACSNPANELIPVDWAEKKDAAGAADRKLTRAERRRLKHNIA